VFKFLKSFFQTYAKFCVAQLKFQVMLKAGDDLEGIADNMKLGAF
jgi:hypothetical protein